MLEETLIHLRILQVVSNDERYKKGLKRLGQGYSKAFKFNPYNPLSYVVLIVYWFFSLLLFGIIGTFKESKNPFKWD